MHNSCADDTIVFEHAQYISLVHAEASEQSRFSVALCTQIVSLIKVSNITEVYMSGPRCDTIFAGEKIKYRGNSSPNY